MLVAGCSSLGSTGPSSRSVRRAGGEQISQANVKVVDATDAIARQINASQPTQSIADLIGEGSGVSATIGRGDSLSISLYEAPPAVLFGSTILDSKAAEGGQTSKGLNVNDQVVDRNGRITVPFAGDIVVAGRTPAEVQRTIVSRLVGRAHRPQAIVRVIRGSSTEVAVVGEVQSAARLPLSATGERLLDAIAAAGGTRQPVSKTAVQLSRGTRVASMPLEEIIKDPRHNVMLQGDDVVTVLYQPYSFTALGAITKPAEFDFEATGVSVTQALGRIGGLRDDRADIRGVFLFRMEDPVALQGLVSPQDVRTPDGKIPVIYRFDLEKPANFFVAQRFRMRDKDILYVSTAPGVDLQRFVSVLSSTAFSIIGLGNSL
jgi:polysaccharide export outer membrane protein